MNESEKQIKSRPKRKAPKTAWKKGQSGNPKGRKPVGTSVAELAREILEAQSEFDEEGITLIRGILKKAGQQARGGDNYARQWIVERAYGKIPDKLITREDKDGLIIDIE